MELLQVHNHVLSAHSSEKEIEANRLSSSEQGGIQVAKLFSARSFQSGDEETLVRLWNAAYQDYGGHVPRSTEYWSWCILQRPGVSFEDIILFSEPSGPREIRGYGVLGPRGSVLEFVVDPSLPRRRRQKLAIFMIRMLEERCRERGDGVIELVLPSTDKPLCRALARAGYAEEVGGDTLQVVISDLPRLLTAILRHRSTRYPRDWSPSFLLELSPGQYRFCPHRLLAIKLGPPATVEVGSANTAANCHVRTDLSTLTDILFHRTTLIQAAQAGCISVQPQAGFADLQKLTKLLVLDGPWYTPNADGR